MEDNTPPFRWYWHRMQLDLVPLDEKVLGFANRWYRAGFDAALVAEAGCGAETAPSVRTTLSWPPSSRPSEA
jgi:hypothetical protein